MQMRWGALVVIGVLAAAACGKSGSGRPGPNEVAGEVVEAAGDVQIEHAGATAAATVGTKVHGADTIITGADGHVTVLLYHNKARWTLDGGKRKRIDQSVAWRAPKTAAGGLLAEGNDDNGTSAAGRHAEKEAADTRATAPTDESMQAPGGAPAAAAPAAAAPPAAEPAPDMATPPPPPPPRHEVSRRSAHGPSDRKMKETAIGTGTLGMLGHGDGGAGSGYGNGSGLGGRMGAAPTVTLQKAGVVGALDPAIIRRIVRQKVPQIRSCYEKAITNKPDLAGAITVDFVVEASGSVGKVEVKGDSAMSAAVGSCVIGVYRAMKFPKPAGGGTVKVSYPLNFAPGS